MSNVGDGLKSDLGTIEGATTSGTAGLQLLRAAFLTLFLRLGRILRAGRLVKNVLNCCRNFAHPNLLASTRSASGFFVRQV
jgi:hypothetical protein